MPGTVCIRKKGRKTGFGLVAGVGFEPHDLRVMSPTSYQAALSRHIDKSGEGRRLAVDAPCSMQTHGGSRPLVTYIFARYTWKSARNYLSYAAK